MPGEMLDLLRTWLDAGLSFFYPEVCQYCSRERATVAEGFICAHCREEVRWIRPPYCERCGLPFSGSLTTAFECSHCRDLELPFECARSAAAAKGMVLDVIHRYKYHRAIWFEPFLAGLLTTAAAPCLQTGGWNLIVPVPLHPRKQSEREFNQAERLARRLSRAVGIPLHRHLLRRVLYTCSQTQLSRDERMANVRHAFALRRQISLAGHNIVLVDDVFTTGATTSACAGILRQAGAARVCVWTVARGLLN